jgi:hypothetical protein
MLFQSIKMQLSVMVRKKSFQISFFIMLGYVLLVFFYYCNKYINQIHDISNIYTADSLFAANDSTEFSTYFNTFFPFIVVFPYSFSFMSDRSVRVVSIMQARMGVKNYYISKAFVCFIGGFILLFIPLLFSILLNQVTFPLSSATTCWGDFMDWNYSNNLLGTNVIIWSLEKGLPFLKLYLFSPLLYNILYTVIISVFSGLLGIFAVTVSFLIKHFKVFLLAPIYIIFFSCNLITNLLESEQRPFYNFEIMSYLTVNSTIGKSYLFFTLLCTSLVLVSTIFLIVKIRSNQLD